MLSIICNMAHNHILLKQCEETINSFLDADNVKIWIEDDKGNRFIPSGNIKIGYLETVSARIRRPQNDC